MARRDVAQPRISADDFPSLRGVPAHRAPAPPPRREPLAQTNGRCDMCGSVTAGQGPHAPRCTFCRGLVAGLVNLKRVNPQGYLAYVASLR